MRILAIDSSTEACSVAVWRPNACVSLYDAKPPRVSEVILEMVQAVLDDAGITLAEVDAFAFGRGPGSFTGVRLATAVIQGLAVVGDKPVMPISTLAALAQGAYRQWGARTVLSAVDARMQEIYWACYHLDADDVWITEQEHVSPPGDLVLPILPNWAAVGSGWDHYRDVLTERLSALVGCWYPGCTPLAEDIGLLAFKAYQRGDYVRAEDALPVYIRDQVAHVRKA